MRNWIFLLLIITACKSPKKETPVLSAVPVAEAPVVPHDSIGPGGSKMISEYWMDGTGYFRVYGPDRIDSLEYTGDDTCRLLRFLRANLDQRAIQILNKQTLAHTFRISADTLWRTDTLRGEHTTIIQNVDQNNWKLEFLSFNGHRQEWPSEDQLDLYSKSFREFNFRGHRFYYLNASIMGSAGGSASLIRYNILYDCNRKSIELFDDFRTHGHLYFGDVDGDDRLDYLDLQNDGGHGLDTINHFRITLWSHNPQTGRFEQRKDSSGIEYFIDGNTGGDYYVGDVMNVDKFYWPVALRKPD